MFIPGRLKVGGHTYTVKMGHRFTEVGNLCGQADHQELEIRVATQTQSNNPRPQSMIDETFLHEALHCVDQVYNNHSLSEEVIDRLSEGLYAVLTDNRLLKE